MPPTRLLVILLWAVLGVTFTSTILWVSLLALPLEPLPKTAECPLVALAPMARKSDVDEAVPLPLVCAARDV
ncbi:hypothetical protein ACGFK1_10430 [Mycobacterium sp. NPDC048908]|uniref:hypothetical protein n=1 Tax=Mycobacterium sp. NPDC048908 TaxID=3364292 RepID=UPI003713C4C5